MVYKSGLMFSEILGKNLDACLKRVKLNKASLLIIYGGIGEGKTTLLVHVLDYFNLKLGFPEIDLKTGDQIGMGGAEFVNKMRLCYEQQLPCVGYDEAGDFSKRGSLTSFNAMLNRTFDTFRSFRCVVVISLPNFAVLDNSLFDNKLPRFMLRLHDRTKNQGNFAAYSLYRMLLLKAKMKKYDLKEFAYKKIEPNFRGHFQNLPKERAEQLDKLSTRSKLHILEKSEVKMAGLLTYIDIATKLGKVVGSVRNAVSNMKIKPSRVIHKVAYFDNDAMNRIEELFNANSESRRGTNEQKV